MSGFYLALEGVEGSGKTTISAALAELAERSGRAVTVVREPGGTPVGDEVRRLLLHSHDMVPWAEATLFAAGRAQLMVEVVGPALAAGHLVISDRSYYSSLAYQGWARGLGIEPVRSLNRAVLGGVEPNLVVILDIDPVAGLDRQTAVDRIGGEGVDFQKAVHEGYRRLATDPGVTVLDARRPVGELVEEIWRQVP